MPLADELHLHRLQYRQGQTLLGEDLNSQAAAAAQLRWWHNRAMHGAFGVVTPLNPVAAGPAGAVTVHPFIAYDCFGRELVLVRPRRVPLPPKPDPGPVPAVPGTPLPQGHKVFKVLLACRPAGHDCRGRVLLVWVDRRDYRPAAGVPLAVALSADGADFSLVPESNALAAEGMSRPLVGTGKTVAGSAAWEAAKPSLGGLVVAGSPAWFDLRIDTSAAGFTRTPCYFAWLTGTPHELEPPYIAWEGVVAGTERSVTYRVVVIFPRGSPDAQRITAAHSKDADAAAAQVFRRVAARRALSVFWVGVQAAFTGAADAAGKEDSHGHP